MDGWEWHSLESQTAPITAPCILSSTLHVHVPLSWRCPSSEPATWLLLVEQPRATVAKATHRNAPGSWKKKKEFFPAASARSIHSGTLLPLHDYPSTVDLLHWWKFAFHGLVVWTSCASGHAHTVVSVSLWTQSLCVSSSHLSLLPASCWVVSGLFLHPAFLETVSSAAQWTSPPPSVFFSKVNPSKFILSWTFLNIC